MSPTKLMMNLKFYCLEMCRDGHVKASRHRDPCNWFFFKNILQKNLLSVCV